MEDTTLSNQIETYLKEDDLTRWAYQLLYLENPLFRDDFKENEYILIIYTEGKFIKENLSAGENIFSTRFLFRHLNLNPSQRYVIILSLKEYVNSMKYCTNSFVNNYKKSIHFKPEKIIPYQYKIDRLGFIENLLAVEKNCMNQQIKYFFNDDFIRQVDGFADVKEKIKYLKTVVVDCEIDENRVLYPYQYKVFLDQCNASIAKLEIDLNEQTNTSQPNRSTNKYSQSVFGLLHYYLSKTGEGAAINGNNMNKLAKDYGFESRTSGTALVNEFGKYQKDGNRLNLSENKRTDGTKQKTFIGVIEILKEQNNLKSLTLANDEYLVFNTKFENYYS